MYSDRHVRAGHQPRHGAGAGAEPGADRGGRACRRRCKRQGVTHEEVAGHPAVRQPASRRTVRYDQLYLSNYATITSRTAWPARRASATCLPRPATTACGSGSTRRNWPPAIMTAGEVFSASRAERPGRGRRRSARPPAPSGQAFQLTINTQGRLHRAGEVRRMMVKTGTGARSRCGSKDVGQGGAGAKDYDVNSYLDGQARCNAGRLPVPGLERPDDGRCQCEDAWTN